MARLRKGARAWVRVSQAWFIVCSQLMKRKALKRMMSENDIFLCFNACAVNNCRLSIKCWSPDVQSTSCSFQQQKCISSINDCEQLYWYCIVDYLCRIKKAKQRPTKNNSNNETIEHCQWFMTTWLLCHFCFSFRKTKTSFVVVLFFVLSLLLFLINRRWQHLT